MRKANEQEQLEHYYNWTKRDYLTKANDPLATFTIEKHFVTATLYKWPCPHCKGSMYPETSRESEISNKKSKNKKRKTTTKANRNMFCFACGRRYPLMEDRGSYLVVARIPERKDKNQEDKDKKAKVAEVIL